MGGGPAAAAAELARGVWRFAEERGAPRQCAPQRRGCGRGAPMRRRRGRGPAAVSQRGRAHSPGARRRLPAEHACSDGWMRREWSTRVAPSADQHGIVVRTATKPSAPTAGPAPATLGARPPGPAGGCRPSVATRRGAPHAATPTAGNRRSERFEKKIGEWALSSPSQRSRRGGRGPPARLFYRRWLPSRQKGSDSNRP